jgi:hypothetical protein
MGIMRTIASSEEATGADVPEVAICTPATADPINVAAMIRLTMVLVTFLSSCAACVGPAYYRCSVGLNIRPRSSPPL